LDTAQPFRLYGTAPGAESSTLVVGWSEDAGRMGAGVIGYLVEKLGGVEFGEIEPEGFFSLAGVSVEGGTARFPESKFYWCPDRSLAVFMSSPPGSDWYRFLDAVLDVAERYCGAKAVYTVGGMVYLGSHTTSRQLLTIANSPETRELLAEYDLALDINYESPPGQRPSLNAFLLWVARNRGIGGISLWVPVPFYMVGVEDPKAWIKALEFLDRRLDLELDLGDLEEAVLTQDTRIAQLQDRSPDVDKCIRRLEGNLSLSEAESEMLASEVQQYLGGSN
jgi:proteasome assembly chaperone (PAC2) family protein